MPLIRSSSHLPRELQYIKFSYLPWGYDIRWCSSCLVDDVTYCLSFIGFLLMVWCAWTQIFINFALLPQVLAWMPAFWAHWGPIFWRSFVFFRVVCDWIFQFLYFFVIRSYISFPCWVRSWSSCSALQRVSFEAVYVVISWLSVSSNYCIVPVWNQTHLRMMIIRFLGKIFPA